MEYYPFNIRFYELKLNRTGNTIKHRSTLPPSPVGVDSFCWTSSKIYVECLHEVEARLSDDVAQGTSFFSDDYTSGAAFVESLWIFGNSLDWRVKHLMVWPVLEIYEIKNFDTIDQRIETFCRAGFETLTKQNRKIIERMRACDDITANMSKLLKQNDIKFFARAKESLKHAKVLSQYLAGSPIDAVKTPQVRLELGQDWSLEGTVSLNLRKVQKVQSRFQMSVSFIESLLFGALWLWNSHTYSLLVRVCLGIIARKLV